MKNSNQKWKCVKNCGACCRLDPIERVEALEVLGEAEAKIYLDLIGNDGWCRFYDTGSKSCMIYNDRPGFCRVSNLSSLYQVHSTDVNQFAITCCRQQIRSTYGGRSIQMKRFEQKLRKN